MTTNRSGYCCGAILFLVALRLVIGGHFFNEGLKHEVDRAWTSEGFLIQAKGPFAEKFQSVLGNFHGWQEIMRGDAPNADAGAWSKAARELWDEQQKKIEDFEKLPDDQRKIHRTLFAWQVEQGQGWRAEYGQFAGHCQLTDKQKQEAEAILARRQTELRDWVDSNREAIILHWNDTRRVKDWVAQPSSEEVPFQQKRILDRRKKLDSESTAWLTDLVRMDRGYRQELVDMLDPSQRSRGLPPDTSKLAQVDRVMKHLILVIGALLIVGLFTRLAALAGAIFLLSIVLAQPFWIAESAPTYPQILEMLTLFLLSRTPVGRWGGLDFFIQSLVCRRCRTGERKPT